MGKNSNSFQKGHTPWNKGKKLDIKPIGMKGKHQTDEWKKQASERMKQQWESGSRDGISEKVSQSLKGHLASDKVREHMRVLGKSQKGEKNFNWKGGITSENEKIRHALEYIIWRNEIYKRDGWTCRLCKSKRQIIAHHLKLFSDFPELRFSTDNGIVLCRSCHAKVHRDAGNKNVN